MGFARLRSSRSMTESLQVITCPKCGGSTVKVTPRPNEDLFFCEGCQHVWEDTPPQLLPTIPPCEKSSDRRTTERRLPTRLVAPECRNCPGRGGMVVETRTERFVYYRCPVCQDFFALRKPERPIALPSSAVEQSQEALCEVELWRLRKGDRELRCIASYLPTGTTLRMMEREECRRTESFQEGPELEQCAQLWRRKLTERGWG